MTKNECCLRQTSEETEESYVDRGGTTRKEVEPRSQVGRVTKAPQLGGEGRTPTQRGMSFKIYGYC